MKKLVIKTSFFVLPFLIMYVVTYYFYRINGGDLQRTGYLNIPNFSTKKGFENDFAKPILFKNLSDIEIDTLKKVDILTIGDSFSAQLQVGYQNYLVEKSNVSILNIDHYINDNPLQTLSDIANSTILDKIKVKVIIFETVERSLAERSVALVDSSQITIKKLTFETKKHNAKPKNLENLDERNAFFSKATLLFPFYNLINFKSDDFVLQGIVYKTPITRTLNKDYKDLVFLENDLFPIQDFNDGKQMTVCNKQLNEIAEKLKSKGITLIFLPAPDKYDLYFDLIKNKKHLVKPLFFDHFRKFQKNYLFIDSKAILEKLSKEKLDVYYYADTHWTPIAAQAIANEIDLQIKSLKYK